MSIESLIFIGIFLLLPLVERLLEWQRQKNRPPAPPPQRPAPTGRPERMPLPPRHRADLPEAPVPPVPMPEPQRPLPQQSRESRGPERQQRPAARPVPRPASPPEPTSTSTPTPLPSAPAPPRRKLTEIIAERRAAETTPARGVDGRPSKPAPSAAARARRPARLAARRIVRSRRGLRQGVVVATVIGPCRAVEPDQ